MKNLILVPLVLLVSCGQTVLNPAQTTGNNGLSYQSLIVIYGSYKESELHDFKTGAKKYFSLDCGSKYGQEKQNCIETSLKEAIKFKYDVCVFDPDLESPLLDLAIANCKTME